MDDNGNDDGGPPTHGDNNRQDQNSPRPSLDPTDAAAPSTVSLTQRAPTASIPTRTWIMHFKINDLVPVDHTYLLGQKNQCIRSQTEAVQRGAAAEPTPTLGFGVGQNAAVGYETVGFPYPSLYRKRIRDAQLQMNRPVQKTPWYFRLQGALEFFEGN